MSEAPQVRQLGAYFAHLSGPGDCIEVLVGSDFWGEGMMHLPPGRLVSMLPTGAAWPTWECHPLGEEFILQLSGALSLQLDDGNKVHEVQLKAGEFVVMPAGWWHTANASEEGQALFITPGEGTEVRER